MYAAFWWRWVQTPSSETTAAASSSLKPKNMKGTKCNYRLWRTANYPGQTYRSTHTSHNGVNNYYRTYNPNFPPLESWIIVIIRTKSLFFVFFFFIFFSSLLGPTYVTVPFITRRDRYAGVRYGITDVRFEDNKCSSLLYLQVL